MFRVMFGRCSWIGGFSVWSWISRSGLREFRTDTAQYPVFNVAEPYDIYSVPLCVAQPASHVIMEVQHNSVKPSQVFFFTTGHLK
jgi:hypothetical protein